MQRDSFKHRSDANPHEVELLRALIWIWMFVELMNKNSSKFIIPG